jgi:PAS domain S-box-containing protein
MVFSVVGDILTTGTFFALALGLLTLARRRTELRGDWRVPAAACALLLTGASHLVEIWSMWQGAYSQIGWLTSVTLVGSITAAYLAWGLVATLVKLPSRRSLQEEIEKRRVSEEEVSKSRALFQETVTRHASEISEAKLKVSRLASIVDNSQDAIIGIESSGEVWEWNPSAERLFGFTEAEALGHSIGSLLSTNGSDVVDRISQSMASPYECAQFEVQCTRKNGTEVPVWLFISPVTELSDGKPGLSIIARDMSEKKQAQERLTQSLADKELLLKEVHHRVKNNLQIICSLLRLQSGYVPEGPARAMFRSSEDRVKCMALVHEKLYRSESLSRISFDGYVSELTKQLVRSHISDPRKVKLEMNLDAMDLSIDKAVPSGLILNELIANSIEYGLGADGALSLSLTLRKKANTAELTVSDKGSGIPKEVDVENPTTLGLRVVATLCKQLNAKLTVVNEGGAVFRFEFPFEKPGATREHTVDPTEAIA